MTATSVLSAIEGQYLTFMIAGEPYGVEILRVQEIKGFSSITPVPNVQSFVSGVMNLRGTIIPIIDLRRRLLMPPAEHDRFTVIVVLKVNEKVVGAIVDAVAEVVNIGEAEIQPAPEIGTSNNAGFLRGIARVEDRLIMLLDVEHTFHFEGMTDDKGSGDGEAAHS